MARRKYGPAIPAWQYGKYFLCDIERNDRGFIRSLQLKEEEEKRRKERQERKEA